MSNGLMLQGKVRYENLKDNVRAHLEQVNLHFHSAPIVAMDACVRKPIIVTASKDKTIKIWNYEDRTVETPKSEAEAASSLSLHPSGLHLVIAYSDKLRVLNLQKDGESLSNFKDINSFKNCSYVKFSNGGQYFAATSGNQLHIFKFYTC
jgi:cilia- and flagella-associated protein 57